MTEHAKRVLAALLCALCLWAVGVTPALAESRATGSEQRAAYDEYGIRCVEGACTIELTFAPGTMDILAPAQVALDVLEKNLHLLPNGAGFEVYDHVTLRLPAGLLEFGDASLRAQMGRGGELQTLQGEARLRIPTLGLMPGWDSVTPVVLRLGFDRGEALQLPRVPLQPDHTYLFVDVGAGLVWTPANATAEGVAVTMPNSQRATFVIDPTAPFIYLDGNVTVRIDGDFAFLQQFWMEPAAEGANWTERLPLRQSITLHGTGIGGPEWHASSLNVQGQYRVDAGWVGTWIQIEQAPLTVEGQIALSREGLLIAGATGVALWPDKLLNSGMAMQFFIPLESSASEPLLALDGHLSLPLASVATQGTFALQQNDLALMVAETQVPLSKWWQESTAWGATRATEAWAATRSSYDWSQAQAQTGVDWLSGGWAWSREHVDAGRQWLFPVSPPQLPEAVATAN